ncbi:probable 6-phosphogluconolactonase 4, chloroplastic, partial [Tanacetum coccineum]
MLHFSLRASVIGQKGKTGTSLRTHSRPSRLLTKSDPVPIPKANIYPIKDNLSPKKAAEEYEHQLKQLVANKKLKTSAVTVMAKFDLTLLGMVQTDSPKPPPLRISFTFPQINSTSKIAMVVTGEDATDAVKVTLGEHADYGYPLPVQKVKPEDGEIRGAIISAMEGQSREAINAGWTPLCAAIVPNFHLPMHSYEVKNMYLMALLNLSASVAETEYVGSSRAENQEDVKGKLTSVKRRGLVDQRRSFNGEVATSTFSTVVATEHVGSSRDETQGEQESLNCFTITIKQSYEGSKNRLWSVPLYAFDLEHSGSRVGLMGVKCYGILQLASELRVDSWLILVFVDHSDELLNGELLNSELLNSELLNSELLNSELLNSELPNSELLKSLAVCLSKGKQRNVYDHDENNVFANERRHSEQSESINDTYLLEKDDSNVTPDSSNICNNDNQVDQNAAECVDERAALANLIANLTLDTEENKTILKQLKKTHH